MWEPSRFHIRRLRAEDRFDPVPHDPAASCWDEESKEDEDVSSFLDSFSASGAAKKTPTSASDGQAREAEGVVFDHAQATLAMSEPLAQVKTKNLARARTKPCTDFSRKRVKIISCLLRQVATCRSAIPDVFRRSISTAF